MKVVHATWEKRNLGVETYEITLTNDDTTQALIEAEQQLKAEKAQYLVVKTPVGNPSFLQGLSQSGYCFMEALFEVTLNKEDYRCPAFLKRFDKDIKVEKVTSFDNMERIFAEIQSGVFDTDRISMDAAFTKEQAATRFANWTRDLINSGDELYEFSLKGEKAGFFTMHKNESIYTPTLMGSYQSFVNKGLGMLLQRVCLETSFELGARKINSVIVANNPKVVRTNLMFGIIIKDIFYTYVKHI